MLNMALPVEDYVTNTLQLLELERAAEIEETRALTEDIPAKELQKKGVCLLNIYMSQQRNGMFGRKVITFEPPWGGMKELPAHNFTPGDIAGVSLSKQEGSSNDFIASGIVSKVTSNSISVAFDEKYNEISLEDGTAYKLLKLANDVTYKRMKNALNALNKYRGGPASNMIDVLFGQSQSGPPFNQARDGKTQELIFFNEQLDVSQKEAVNFALHQRELAIIHGPPGTGKTTTVVEIIRQAAKQGLKILACAPSNIAVDNLVERLSNCDVKMVRLGHPARLLPSIQKFSLDAVIAGSEEKEVVTAIRQDINKTMVKLQKTNNRGEKESLRRELRLLRKDLTSQEMTATARVLKDVQVVMTTLATATDSGPMKHLEEEHFDIIIIDECSQALEAACWIALLRGPRCILAGDHKQLPPTILSNEAAKAGLEKTLMERLIDLHGKEVVRMLTVQYRMNHLIMDWASEQLYDGQLVAHDSVRQHLLYDLKTVNDTEDTRMALVLIDTAGCEMVELDTPDDISKGNEGEVELVAAHVDSLVSSGLNVEDIAVIAPYNLQVELLRLKMSVKYPKLEIKSVDGFQGREKEAVIISLVRSNNRGIVGFLAEDRRINVAITRARRHLALVCDSETVSHHPFIKSLADYLMEFGEVRSAQSYIQDGTVTLDSQRPEFLTEKLKDKSQRKTSHKQPIKNKEVSRKEMSNPIDQSYDRAERAAKQKLEAEALSQKFEQILDEFLKNKKEKEYHFDIGLSARDRFIIHELAEKLGLIHISQGEGNERYISVCKEKPEVVQMHSSTSIAQQENRKITECKTNKSKDDTISIHGKAKNQDDTAAIIDNKNKQSHCHSNGNQSNDKVCEKCKREVPKSNLELHKLRCKGLKTTEIKPELSKQKRKKVKKKTAQPEEDFDSLINAAVKENSHCTFPKCKTLTVTLGMNCKFCAKRFCLSHHIAESHGCGDAAKTAARQLISREGVLYRGSGVASKKPDPVKRAHLQRKLNSKLDDLSQQRTNKKKDKK